MNKYDYINIIVCTLGLLAVTIIVTVYLPIALDTTQTCTQAGYDRSAVDLDLTTYCTTRNGEKIINTDDLKKSNE